MSKLQPFVLLVFVGLLIGCASKPALQTGDIEIGMTPKEVKERAGEPKDRTFRGKRENWIYPSEGGRQKLVIFESGKVVELLNAEAGNSVLHEAKKGDADAARAATHCAGSNKYGRYVDGGGCNMYGCWPPGGYCNGFGCSATGFCTSSGCPNKIASFQCQD